MDAYEVVRYGMEVYGLVRASTAGRVGRQKNFVGGRPASAWTCMQSMVTMYVDDFPCYQSTLHSIIASIVGFIHSANQANISKTTMPR